MTDIRIEIGGTPQDDRWSPVDYTGHQTHVMIGDEVMKIVSVKDILHNGKPAKELTLSRYPHKPETECKNIIQDEIN